MAFVRALNALCRDKKIGKYVVPIVPDESRTFGMEGMFRQLGIYNPKGQLYTPQDADQLSYYKESKDGQVLQEGINEAGAMADWIAAATAYSVHGVPMIPFYIYYSMFGFQRVGDLAWAAGDSRARGFLLGGTAGRTTLNGEGLQHEDGHSHILAGTIPNCITYDPVLRLRGRGDRAGRPAADVRRPGGRLLLPDGLQRELPPPGDAGGRRAGHRQGALPLLEDREAGRQARQPDVLGHDLPAGDAAAKELLEADFGITADLWVATSLNELAREAQDVERSNRMYPTSAPKMPYVTETLGQTTGPVIAVTDYMKNYAEQIRAFVPHPFHVLGTDGFGRSDSRENLRRHFEVDANHIAATAVYALYKDGKVTGAEVEAAYAKYAIDPAKINPRTA